MSGDKVWPTVGLPIYSKGVESVWGLSRPPDFFHTLVGKPFLHGSGFGQGTIKTMKQEKDHPQKATAMLETH